MWPDLNTEWKMISCNYKYDYLKHIKQLLLYKHNYITFLEPRIQTRNGIRKLDLIIFNTTTSYLIDTHINRHNTSYLA